MYTKWTLTVAMLRHIFTTYFSTVWK